MEHRIFLLGAFFENCLLRNMLTTFPLEASYDDSNIVATGIFFSVANTSLYHADGTLEKLIF